MLKFSLIVPIYNVEKFLPQCLSSLLAQDIPLNEYEIICVIDGSTDNCVNIVKEYMNKYTNIVLVEQENQGLASARNSGIAVVNGEYVWFIDSDDFITSNCLGELYNELKTSNFDMLRFGYIYTEEESIFNKDTYVLSNKYENIEKSSASACFYVVKSSVYRNYNLKFEPKLKYAEDLFFTFLLERLNVKIKTRYDLALYFYRKRKNSLMNSKEDTAIKNRINNLLLLIKYINTERKKYIDNKIELQKIDKIISRLCVSILIQTVYRDKKNYKNILNEMKQEGVVPLKFPQGYFNLKQCKTIKQFILMSFECLMYKNWFINLIAKFT